VRASGRDDLGSTGTRLESAVAALRRATDFIVTAEAAARTTDVLAGATAYLRLFALAASGVLLAKGALAAPAQNGHAALARYFSETLVDETAALCSTVTEGAAAHRLAADAWFGETGMA
jgi:hypothetical protein